MYEYATVGWNPQTPTLLSSLLQHCGRGFPLCSFHAVTREGSLYRWALTFRSFLLYCSSKYCKTKKSEKITEKWIGRNKHCTNSRYPKVVRGGGQRQVPAKARYWENGQKKARKCPIWKELWAIARQKRACPLVLIVVEKSSSFIFNTELNIALPQTRQTINKVT